jgi:hypothetical protein
MRLKSTLGILSSLLLAACFELESGSGSDSATGGASGSAGSDGTVEPELAQTPEAEDTPVGVADGEEIFEEKGVLEVSPELYAVLLQLQDGDSLASLPNVDGTAEFVNAFTASLPVSGAPNALCAEVTMPVQAAGCAELYPELLDAGSHDTDGPPVELPLEGLEASLSTYQACGLGVHFVTMSVYDMDGSFSSCTSTVRVCDPASDDTCPDQIVKSPNTIAIAAQPEAMACKWIVTGRQSPNTHQTLTLSNYSYQEKGPGPRYWRSSKDLEARSCLNPPDHQESFSETIGGDKDFDINVVCFDAAQKAVVNPGCESKVDVRAFYRSQVRAMSEVGLACGGNGVEAYAQDEAAFTVNNNAVFAKSVIVQNGTEASTSVSFSLGAEVGKSAEGLSANATVGFGWTRNFTDKTADKTDFLRADGITSLPTPVTGRLQANARTYLKIADRAWGLSDVRTSHWLVAYTGTSACPMAAPVAYGTRQFYTNVLPDELKQDVAAANAFYKTRGFNVAFQK